MTDQTSKSGAATATRAIPERYQPLGRYLDNRIGQIVSAQQQHRQGVAATLAALRNAATLEPGASPETWAPVFEGLPADLRGDDRRGPSAEERAVHTALCLWAIHQQSLPASMHVPSRSFGAAVAQLGRSERSEKAVLRRFQALATSSSFSESVVHARSLVQLLRAAKIGFDYGRFAVDLARLQDPAGADRVRLAWGRDYFGAAPVRETADASETTTTGDSE